MNFDKAPVPVDPAQWPEGRAFVRVYARDPENQARLAMALISFQRELEMRHRSPEAIEAIDVVLRAFRSFYPEFMEGDSITDSESSSGGEVYRMDNRLLTFMPE